MTTLAKTNLFVIDETNGGGSLDPDPQMSIFFCIDDPEFPGADYIGTHITTELIDAVMNRVDEDANIEIILGRNIEGENLLWFRHAKPEGLDWGDEAEQWQEALRKDLKLPA